MNTRDQFGNYLLLKKLAEDPLGETFRAGRVGRQTLDRVVLLRVLNGAGFDPERIARALQARSPLAQALKSPTIGQATDVGQVRGVPYIAYDYSSGRSLSQLLEQAARRHQQLPLDHAVLIAERVALALAVAFETRLGDERVQHGFVTPHLVHVSNEGEVKLLGFEASTGLRESAAHPLIKQAASGYLSPETLAGQPLHKSDDVYSVAALLLEMLTGQAPAVNAANLRGAIVAAEGTPIPAELAALLERSLCPRDQRVPDIVSWHKSLAKLMADSGWAATTFNIAFFLHNLYRDEIDREARELETEKSQAAALVASSARTAELAPAAAAAPSAAPSAVRSTGPIREDTSVLRDEYGIPGKKRGASPALLGGIAAAVVVLGVGGYLLFGSGGSTTAAPATPPPAPVTEAAPAAAPAPTGMTPEQIQSMIQEALANQKKETEAEQRVSEEKLKALQKQLEDAQRVRLAPPPSVQIASPAPSSSAPATTQAAAAPATTPAAPATTAPNQGSTANQPATTAPSTPAPAPVQAKPVVPAPAPVQPVAKSAPEPSVREGDLVSMGPGVVAPRVVRQPPLPYPQVALRMKKEATITVRVLIDENGRVIDVEEPSSKAGFGLDEAAVAHARNCIWEAAKKDGIKVKMWTELKVAFKL